jgi:hypothetical protein
MVKAGFFICLKRASVALRQGKSLNGRRKGQKRGRREQRSLGSSGTRNVVPVIGERERKEGGGLSWNGLSKTGCGVTSRGAVGALRGLCNPLRATMESELAMMMMAEVRTESSTVCCRYYFLFARGRGRDFGKVPH